MQASIGFQLYGAGLIVVDRLRIYLLVFVEWHVFVKGM